MDKWQIIRDGVVVGTFDTIEEAEVEYAKSNCDEIRRVSAQMS